MTIVICDDDESCIINTKTNIEHWIEERSRNDEIIVFNNGDDLLDHLSKNKADLVFLDIMMPFLDGMETAHLIRERSIDVNLIFLTSTPDFAIESYDVNASGYMLKPIIYEKMAHLLDRMVVKSAEKSATITIKTNSGYRSLEIPKIECLEAQGKNVVFHMSDGTTAEAIGKFSSYEEILMKENVFFKCHRSYILGLGHINNFSSAEATTVSGLTCPIARGLGQAFKDAYFRFMFPDR